MDGKQYNLDGRFKVMKGAKFHFCYMIILGLLLSPIAFAAKKKQFKVGYLNIMFGQIFKAPSKNSSALTTITCGQPLKVYSQSKKASSSVNWRSVELGTYKGYVHQSFISFKRGGHCFQSRYPEFMQKIDLGLTESFYFGQLYNRYIIGKSKAN